MVLMLKFILKFITKILSSFQHKGESNDFPFASRFAKNLLDSNSYYDYEQNEIGFEPKAPRKNSKRIKFQDDKMRKKLDFFKRLNYIEN